MATHIFLAGYLDIQLCRYSISKYNSIEFQFSFLGKVASFGVTCPKEGKIDFVFVPGSASAADVEHVIVS